MPFGALLLGMVDIQNSYNLSPIRTFGTLVANSYVSLVTHRSYINWITLSCGIFTLSRGMFTLSCGIFLCSSYIPTSIGHNYQRRHQKFAPSPTPVYRNCLFCCIPKNLANVSNRRVHRKINMSIRHKKWRAQKLNSEAFGNKVGLTLQELVLRPYYSKRLI